MESITYRQKFVPTPVFIVRLVRPQKKQIERQVFYEIEEIVQSAKKKVIEAERKNEEIDYITFVSDGEPTLDINIGEEIKQLKQIGIKIAVITNASLLGKGDVVYDLLITDWVSVKVDAASEEI